MSWPRKWPTRAVCPHARARGHSYLPRMFVHLCAAVGACASHSECRLAGDEIAECVGIDLDDPLRTFPAARAACHCSAAFEGPRCTPRPCLPHVPCTPREEVHARGGKFTQNGAPTCNMEGW